MKFSGKEYQVRSSQCKKAKCFVPFSGNGINICRLYEIGRCPKQEDIQYFKTIKEWEKEI